MKYTLIALLILSACAKKSSPEANPIPLICSASGIDVVCGGKQVDLQYEVSTILSVAVTNGGPNGPCVLINFTNQTDVTTCGKYVDAQNHLTWQK